MHDWEDSDGWVDRTLEGCRRTSRPLPVLHDAYAAPMRHLDRFLGAALDAGHRFVDEFPADCVPILRGRPVQPLDGFRAPQPMIRTPS